MNPSLNNAQRYLEFSLWETGREQCIPEKKFSFSVKNYYLLHYVVAGQGTFESNGKSYHLRKGELFFIFPNEFPHYYPDQNNPWTYLWLGFNGFNAKAYLDIAGINEKNPIFRDDQAYTLRGNLEEIYQVYSKNGYLDLHALGIGYEFMSNLMKIGHVNNTKLTSKDVHVNSAKEFMMNNYQFDIKIDDIASNVGISPHYLATIFQSVAGCTTKAYLSSLRINRAKTMLIDTNKSIKYIAVKIGFSNQLYFSSFFKKHVGESPLYYRQKGSKL